MRIWPTPLMFSSRGLICLSAISVTSRSGRGEETTICMMGVRIRIELLHHRRLRPFPADRGTPGCTLSRTSCAPTSPLLSSVKLTTTVEFPSIEVTACRRCR